MKRLCPPLGTFQMVRPGLGQDQSPKDQYGGPKVPDLNDWAALEKGLARGPEDRLGKG